MEAWASSALERAEAWAKSCRKINILKRLQREAFCELMKLRDRQEKVERALAFYKTGKGSPFQETGGTRMRGVVSSPSLLNMAGIRTGVDSRFIFETVTRQRDTLVAEFVARQDGPSAQVSNVPGSQLTLSKVTYLANINDWLSLVSVPFGARCQDFSFGSYPSQQGLMEPSSFDPPLLNRYLGCAAGLRLKCSNITATASQSVSRHLGTFGQFDFQLLEGARVSAMGLWQVSGSPPQRSQAIQMSPLEPLPSSQAEDEQPSGRRPGAGDSSSGSAAVVLESELDDSSRIRGWVEWVKPDLRSSEQSLQWGLSLSDTPEEEVGWGLAVGGRTSSSQRRVQFEGFLNFCIGKRLTLQPGLVYTVDGKTQFPALVVSSRWAL
ncbi:unnamed protein product [Spirodela intermedia]|uniref:Uncharacterized protein n=1 Tax=Spirodela intermedia TaxID=51605 RepID=A0A7I8ITK9_SPIIN|nr:unnamed protein product [Spirodela intermedia]CAA6660294.1 unnamed protein product [Spirodela intermedia]